MIKGKDLSTITQTEAIHVWKLAFGDMIHEMFNDEFHNSKFDFRNVGSDEKPHIMVTEIDRKLCCIIDSNFNVYCKDMKDDSGIFIQHQAYIHQYFMKKSYYSF